jgi:hypothetical protein
LRSQAVLHLHRLEHDQGVAGFNGFAGPRVDRHHPTVHRCDQAAVARAGCAFRRRPMQRPGEAPAVATAREVHRLVLQQERHRLCGLAVEGEARARQVEFDNPQADFGAGHVGTIAAGRELQCNFLVAEFHRHGACRIVAPGRPLPEPRACGRQCGGDRKRLGIGLGRLHVRAVAR